MTLTSSNLYVYRTIVDKVFCTPSTCCNRSRIKSARWCLSFAGIRPDEVVLSRDEALSTNLPLRVSLSGRDFYVHQHEGNWVVYPQTCPHQLGPLSKEIGKDGTVTCPWHGYSFDLETGACTTGHTCRFGRRPEIIETEESLKLVWVD